ncbi:hypothetical protein IEQ44_09090 [Nocardioides sp. Y6]|uniref:FUSC family protein n=1 Tax=Nocardioides malaquae TaxID=2773426 RepID=A0ABR9RTA8_9ACTN|nr:hypothetical protein [Nocardioides malaquae]MBE7324808.1 hypothetical protein [Nocardioides malaquae]
MQQSALRRASDAVGRRPLIPVAVKAALAASLAWLVVLPLGGVADRYTYYAPLGAVVVVSSRLGQSLRWSIETVLAIGLGATLAVSVRWAEVPDVVGIALVVGLGTLVGAWRRVASMGSWVPVSGLFILIVGRADPDGYVLGYLGLTAIGAAVGVLVNVVAPPLPLVATRHTQERLRDVIADQMEGLARGLLRDPLPTSAEWREGDYDMHARAERAQELVAQTQDAAQMNWRVRKYRQTARRIVRQDEALGEMTFLLRELVTLLSDEEHAHVQEGALGPGLRPAAADALTATAQALRSVDDATAAAGAYAGATEATDRLAAAIMAQRDAGEGEFFAAGSLVHGLRRLLRAIAPA